MQCINYRNINWESEYMEILTMGSCWNIKDIETSLCELNGINLWTIHWISRLIEDSKSWKTRKFSTFFLVSWFLHVLLQAHPDASHSMVGLAPIPGDISGCRSLIFWVKKSSKPYRYVIKFKKGHLKCKKLSLQNLGNTRGPFALNLISWTEGKHLLNDQPLAGLMPRMVILLACSSIMISPIFWSYGRSKNLVSWWARKNSCKLL